MENALNFRVYIYKNCNRIAFKVKVAHWKCLHYCSSRFALAAIMRAFSMLDFNFKSNSIIPGGQFSQGTKHILSHIKIIFEQYIKHIIMSKLLIRSNIFEKWYLYVLYFTKYANYKASKQVIFLSWNINKGMPICK